MSLYAGGGALLANINFASHYWSRAVPGMIIGSFGVGAMYICCSKMLIQTGPPSMSGVLGATFNSALQTGYVLAIAISLALIGQIGTPGTFDGFRAAFYALTVIGGAGSVVCLTFMSKGNLAMDDSIDPATAALPSVAPLESPASFGEQKSSV